MNQHCKIFIAADTPYDLWCASFGQKYHQEGDISITSSDAFLKLI